MAISVVIPAYRREDILIQCMVSLDHDAITSGIECELCIVDDGSGIDEGAVRTAADMSIPLRWQAFNTPRGRGAARNAGINKATNDIIIFLDGDMVIEPGFLSAHQNAHLSNPKTAVIGRIIWPDGGSFYKYIGTRGAAKLKPGDAVPPWYFVTGNASLERKDIPDRPFDETLPGWGGEDLDLGMRLNASGIRFITVPDAQSYHYFDGTLRSHIVRTEDYGRNTLPVLVSRFPKLSAVTRINLMQSAFWRFAVSAGVAYPLEVFARTFDSLPLPMRLFDYLTFAAYSRGYLRGIQP